MRTPILGERVQTRPGARYGYSGVVLARWTDTGNGWVATLKARMDSRDVHVNVGGADLVSYALVRAQTVTQG